MTCSSAASYVATFGELVDLRHKNSSLKVPTVVPFAIDEARRHATPLAITRTTEQRCMPIYIRLERSWAMARLMISREKSFAICELTYAREFKFHSSINAK